MNRRRDPQTAATEDATQRASATAEATARRAIELFANDDDAALRDLFDHRMKLAVSLEKLADTRQRAQDALGSLMAVGEPLTGSSRGAEVYDFPLTYERGDGHLQIAIRADQIAGLLVRPGHATGTWGQSRGLLRKLVGDFVRNGWLRLGGRLRGKGHA